MYSSRSYIAVRPHEISYRLNPECDFKLEVRPPYCGNTVESKRVCFQGVKQEEKSSSLFPQIVQKLYKTLFSIA